MAQKKKEQLREFLRQRLDAGNTKGLHWINKEELVFELPWKHQNDADWEDKDAVIFREWGDSKGRDTTRIADLKATFRSGLKKTRYVEVLQDKERCKICKLVYPEGEDNVTTPVSSPQEQTTDTAPVRERVPYEPREGEENLPTTILNITPPSSLSLGSLTKYLNGDKEITANVDCLKDLFDSIAASEMSGVEEYEADPAGQQLAAGAAEDFAFTSLHHQQPTQPGPITSLPSDLSSGHYCKIDFSKVSQDGHVKLGAHDLLLIIKYRGSPLNREHIQNDKGFRIAHYKPHERDLYQELTADMITPNIPAYREDEDVYLTRARGLGEAIGHGLYIFTDGEGNIHAIRISKLRIFYTSSVRGRQAEPEKLPRNKDVIVFNYQTFIDAFEAWFAGKSGAKPDIRVLFSFGEKCDVANPYQKCHISATIVSARAAFLLQSFQKENKVEGMEMSDSSSWNGGTYPEVQEVSSEMERMSFD